MDFNYEKNFLYIYGQILNAYKKYSSENLGNFDLSPIEVEILKFLINNGDSYRSSKDIVRFKGVSKGLVSKGVKSLVASGYIKTKVNKEDKRSLDLYITEKAGPLVGALAEINKDFKSSLFKDISPGELEVFYSINKKFIKNLRDLESI